MSDKLRDLKVKLFADGADLQTMVEMAKKPYIVGLTTNPTLMRKAGINNYRQFGLEVLSEIKNKPISFEVFSDDTDEMISQGMEIAGWAPNVNVKIPITNSKGEFTGKVIRQLSDHGVSLNITAIFTVDQVKQVMQFVNSTSKTYISIFAGRIADTGTDPLPIMQNALDIISQNSNTELIWASPRELLNVIQADNIGCHIITATPDILSKIDVIGKDLSQYSLETVRMFRNDAVASGFSL